MADLCFSPRVKHPDRLGSSHSLLWDLVVSWCQLYDTFGSRPETSRLVRQLMSAGLRAVPLFSLLHSPFYSGISVSLNVSRRCVWILCAWTPIGPLVPVKTCGDGSDWHLFGSTDRGQQIRYCLLKHKPPAAKATSRSNKWQLCSMKCVCFVQRRDARQLETPEVWEHERAARHCLPGDIHWLGDTAGKQTRRLHVLWRCVSASRRWRGVLAVKKWGELLLLLLGAFCVTMFIQVKFRAFICPSCGGFTVSGN